MAMSPPATAARRGSGTAAPGWASGAREPSPGGGAAERKFRAVARRWAQHAGSHADLLPRVDAFGDSAAAEAPRLDLIVVPAARSFAVSRVALEAALALARDLGARVLVLASAQARPAEFPAELLGDRQVPTVVLDVPQRTPLPSFHADRHHFAQTCWSGYGDLATKRNLGLMFAAAMGWRHVLFLDDDIRIPVPGSADDVTRLFGVASVRQALAVLAGRNAIDAAGWTMTSYPDNSVVCHARRLARMGQSSFISGGALLVRMTSSTPYFPRLYNEDWLFFRNLIGRSGRGQAIAWAGTIEQDEYDPFQPTRARREELADLFAEATFSLLNRGAPARDLAHSKYFWSLVVHQRRAMIEDVIRELRPWQREALTRALRRLAEGEAIGRLTWDCVRAVRRRFRARRALRASLEVIADTREQDAAFPQMFIGYLEAMRKDLVVWRGVLGAARSAPFLSMLRRHGSVFGCGGLEEFLAMDRADLDRADLDRADLDRADLDRADLDAVCLS
jgi:Pentapeptide repeats (8 copies)